MSTGTVELARSFMMSGPALRITLPDAFDDTPALASVVNIGGFNGRTGRQIAFIPWHLAPETFDQSDRYQLVETKTVGGRAVEIYRRVDDVLWILMWRLSTGILQTHVLDEDGYDIVEAMATLEVFDEGHAGVAVVPAEPLRRYAERRPGYQELIQFFSTEGDFVKGYVELRRPGNLAYGARRHSATAAGETLEVGLRHNLEVMIEVHTALGMSAEVVGAGVLASLG